MGLALVTDLYELKMAASYLRRGMVGPATFSLFARNLPPDRGFLVAGGLEDCVAYLESFAFDDDDLRWLAEAGFDRATVAAFGRLRFTGDVWAVPEGSVVLPNEPLIEVTAPIAEAQLVETYLLNQVTFQTAIVTKAARCRLAAPRIALVDFALRRTHGAEAGMAVARLSAIAGFDATSNVAAAARFGLIPAGTMAHSYVQAFGTEEESFRAFATDFPDQPTFLVDTYDTLEGVCTAIRVIRDQRPTGPLAVRLDSGDLADLAVQTRALLDAADLPDVRIFVSGSLDEHTLDALSRSGAPIDAAGVGTRMGVSADAPYLDTAYKLVEFGARPVLKLSTAKATWPGAKQVWRGAAFGTDVLALRAEACPRRGDEPVLAQVMRRGRRISAAPSLTELRARCGAGIAGLPASVTALRRPEQRLPIVSPALRALAEQVRRDLRAARHPQPIG